MAQSCDDPLHREDPTWPQPEGAGKRLHLGARESAGTQAVHAATHPGGQ